jgi:methanogenic corrinoid protein MtbC1
MASDISANVVELKKDEVLQAVREGIQRGEDPAGLLEECREGMTIVGEKFQEGDFFLAELILSAEIFKAAMAELKPHLATSAPAKKRGTVMLATLKGDIHDLGKNLLKDLLEVHGFVVHDLGIDVDPQVVISKVKEVKPQFVGFSALMTTSFKVMEQTITMLKQEGLRDGCRLMIGGGVTTRAVAEQIGADFQTVDAMKGVEYCKNHARGGEFL